LCAAEEQETNMADQAKKADAQIKKLERAEDGKKAMSEYEAEIAATYAKTERLRALRLAREAEQQAAAKAAPAKAGAKAKPGAKGGKKSAGKTTLADWMKEQQRAGRRS
jgi:hypothetical protein